MKIEQEILKELEGLRDFESYSKNSAMNTGYRTAILDAIDIVTKCFTQNSEVFGKVEVKKKHLSKRHDKIYKVKEKLSTFVEDDN